MSDEADSQKDQTPHIVYPANGYASNRVVISRPRSKAGTPFEQDIKKLKRRYKICDVIQNDDLTISITLLHHPTDPEWLHEWLDEQDGLLFCIHLPSSDKTKIEEGATDIKLEIISPATDLAQLAAPVLNRRFIQLCKSGITSVYSMVAEIDKYYLTNAFLEAGKMLHDQKLENQEKESSSVAAVKEPTPQDIPGEEEWSVQEQEDLEEALSSAETQDFPDIKHKWRWIANKVGNKSAKQCAQRYNECRQKALEQVQTPAASSDAAPGVSLANELTVKNMGSSLDASGIDMKGIQDLLLAKATIQLRCTRCRNLADLTTSSLKQRGVTSTRYQCSTCKQPGVVHIVPSTMTPLTPGFGKILAEGGVLRDINAIDCHATCSECSTSALLTKIVRGAKRLARCYECHTNQHVKIDSFFVGSSGDGKETDANKKKKVDGQQFVFKIGFPLPDEGKCKHYRKSNRWLRFPCCGKAYPCDICHDAKEDHENVYATRMICGFCSREMPFSNTKTCVCGKNLNKVSSVFWEGGQGTRNKNAMSSKDKHKYTGMTKTMSNKAKAEKFGKKKK